MTILKNYFSRFLLLISLGLCFMAIANDALAVNESPEDNTVKINTASQQMAGISVTTLQPQRLTTFIPAPGEVIPNAALTSKVTTRVSAQVVKREVQEGQHVKMGDILATLSSVDMAKVQGNLLLATQEWERVKSLGKDAVSGKRYSEAQVAYQHAYSTALAYGMTETEMKELLRTQKPSQSKGEFTLLAPRDGTVFAINFTEGELIDPGKVLLQIVDEATVWVDAKLPPNLAQLLKIGDTAQTIVDKQILQGYVIQIHHQVDEITRTRSIRLEVPNQADLLHPGQFVNCQVATGQTEPVLALPMEAVLRTADGDWAVYIEKTPEEFQQREVKLVEILDEQAVIEGIASGTRVVNKGAFFVHSELSKKGFDVHGH